MSWDKARLQDATRSMLQGRALIVVANREPYIHVAKDGRIECQRPAGGLTAALDPVMRACGGTWIAHGSGSADRDTADEHGRLGVPPEAPTYTLRRIWLTEEEEEGYYYGFANNALWPLCHQAYCRPEFDPDTWETYRAVNQRFADAVIEEAGDQPALVFVQDYHFALLPRLLKNARPDLTVAQFWHIPWPNPETFSVCPWAAQILDGLLGNDLMAFHIQYHCNNFRDTVERALECLVDHEHFAIVRGGNTTRVLPYPISIDPDLAAEYLGNDWPRTVAAFRQRHGMADRPFLISVDRMDYTKGIPERLWALGRLLEKHPELRGRFHLVQVGAPSRTHLGAYQRLDAEVERRVEEVNRRFGTADWRPVVFVHEHTGPEVIYPLYRAAAGCVVSSLHDGMNLVAKEFVSARDDELGTLVLSRFTGAARELPDALIVNPFDLDQSADAMLAALTQPAEEQRARMQRMRRQVAEYNIYRWAGRLLAEGVRLGEATEALVNRHAAATTTTEGAIVNGNATEPASVRPAGPGDAPWVETAAAAWRDGRRLALLFDYDGTLTPIVPHPELAILAGATRDLIAGLARRERVVVGIVSSRALDDVRDRVGVPGIYYAGCGGIDLRGEARHDPVERGFRATRDKVADLLREKLGRYPGAWVEVKPSGLTVHYRAVEAALAEGLRAKLLELLASRPGLVVRDVKLALEIVPVEAWDKGTAVAAILDHAGGDGVPVYAGDAANDEPALDEVGRRGGVRLGVGDECPAGVDHRVASPAELTQACQALLARLLT